ncbi:MULTISPECIES: hypothetical protein [Cohnella]|uniref:hypothetical protein n=1 Tax=Cohnella TaxID=329857 RepID=UPI0011196D58|nr:MULTISPECIES: hypothetical protein [Cohnella]MBN2980914.1 hypothetical protein [Cohnella algarum]
MPRFLTLVVLPKMRPSRVSFGFPLPGAATCSMLGGPLSTSVSGSFAFLTHWTIPFPFDDYSLLENDILFKYSEYYYFIIFYRFRSSGPAYQIESASFAYFLVPVRRLKICAAFPPVRFPGLPVIFCIRRHTP